MNENLEVKNQTQDVERTRARRVFMPRADIYESDDAVHLVADMPGVDEKSVDVALNGNVLTISGTVSPRVPEGYRLVYAEFESGDFSRSFRLSHEADAQRISAVVKNGVLRVLVPKLKPAQKKIPVMAE